MLYVLWVSITDVEPHRGRLRRRIRIRWLKEEGKVEEEVEFSWTQCYLWYLSHRGRAKASRRNTECQVLLQQHRRRVGGAHGGQLRVSGAASFSSSWARLCGWLCRNQYYGAAQGNSTRSLSPSTLQQYPTLALWCHYSKMYSLAYFILNYFYTTKLQLKPLCQSLTKTEKKLASPPVDYCTGFRHSCQM